MPVGSRKRLQRRQTAGKFRRPSTPAPVVEVGNVFLPPPPINATQNTLDLGRRFFVFEEIRGGGPSKRGRSSFVSERNSFVNHIVIQMGDLSLGKAAVVWASVRVSIILKRRRGGGGDEGKKEPTKPKRDSERNSGAYFTDFALLVYTSKCEAKPYLLPQRTSRHAMTYQTIPKTKPYQKPNHTKNQTIPKTKPYQKPYHAVQLETTKRKQRKAIRVPPKSEALHLRKRF